MIISEDSAILQAVIGSSVITLGKISALILEHKNHRSLGTQRKRVNNRTVMDDILFL